jgi:hypothetical protein
LHGSASNQPSCRYSTKRQDDKCYSEQPEQLSHGTSLPENLSFYMGENKTILLRGNANRREYHLLCGGLVSWRRSLRSRWTTEPSAEFRVGLDPATKYQLGTTAFSAHSRKNQDEPRLRFETRLLASCLALDHC